MIALAPSTMFNLTAVNNRTNGANGLPVITGNLTILGGGGTIARSLAPGTPPFRLFCVAAGATLTLKDVTVANGLAQGDARTNRSADSTLDGCGGAIFVAAGGSLIVRETTFTANRAVGGDGGGHAGGWGIGGAIENLGAAELHDATFNANRAVGGATTHGRGSGGFAFGGAIDNGNSGTLIVRNCLFTGNQAIGGLRHDPSAAFDGMGSSGAINNWNIALVADSTFENNRAVGGAGDAGVDGSYGVAGAIQSGSPFSLQTDITIQRCIFSHNEAVGADTGAGKIAGTACGGAVGNGYSQIASTMTVTDCSFTANQALGGNGCGGWGQGGALILESPSAVTITNSIFNLNKAIGGAGGGAGMGGAIWNIDWDTDDGSGAPLAISDCTFTGNQALGGDGGDGASPDSVGAWGYGQSGAVETSGNTTIVNSTFENNSAVGGRLLPGAAVNFNTACVGGGLSSWGGTLKITGSSLVGNCAIGCAGIGESRGGIGQGGGIAIVDGNAVIDSSSLMQNLAAGGDGFYGGEGWGGGLCNAGTTSITKTFITDNEARGGAADEGGVIGTGIGGGVYNAAAIFIDTLEAIFDNVADLSPDCFGCGE
jgi:hypothetical protein